MWFLGLMLGAALGAIVGGGPGVFLGAFFGALGGFAYSQTRRAAADDRLSAFEERLAALEAKLAALDRGDSATTPTQTRVDEAPATPTDLPPIVEPVVEAPRAEPVQAPVQRPIEAPQTVVEREPALEQRTTEAGSSVEADDPAETVLEPEEPQLEPLASAPSRETDLSPLVQRLIGGNIVAKAGVLILFLGVGFLLKYAYERGRLPIEARLAGVAVAGLAMLFVGWRLRATRRLYGLILQGGGIGLLYLDVFFALRLYGLIGAVSGFAAFMALGVAATLLAVRQDAKILAVLGLTGAFLAPILAGSKSGNHVLLFSYYALLNVFILAISWFRAWRELNLVGFVFTFAVGAFWAARNYRPELFATVEPFVVAYFAMYLVIPILFARRQPPQLKGLVDATLVFGTPLCAAFMQAGLVRDMPNGLAWSAGLASGLYAMLAFATWTRDGMRLLAETYVALAVVFTTLAIFFAFDAYPTFALWTLEGAAILWVGFTQRRLLARLFGYGLQAAATIYFLNEYPKYRLSNPWWNEFVLGSFMIAASGFIIAWLLHRYRERRSDLEPTETSALAWAALWWVIAVVHALRHAYVWPSFIVALLAFVAASATLFELIGARLQWRALRRLAVLQLPALIPVAVLVALGDDGRLMFARPLASGGWWAWPLNFIVLFWINARQLRDGARNSSTAAWFLMGVIATWDVLWLLDRDLFLEAMAWGAAAIAAACVRYRLRERGRSDADNVALPALVWGLAFWFVSGFRWIEADIVAPAHGVAFVAVAAVSCVVFEFLGTRVQWPVLRCVANLLTPAMIFAFLLGLDRAVHPLANYGWLAWAAALAALYLILRRQETAEPVFQKPQHLAALWLAIALLTWELGWQVDAADFGRPWLVGAVALVPALSLAAIAHLNDRAPWPFGAHYTSIYRDLGLGPIALFLAAWTLHANLAAPGSMQPVTYVPLFNPLDVAQLAAFGALWRWLGTLRQQRTDTAVLTALAAATFLWVNAVMLRTMHYWADIPYRWDALSRSILVQAGFSLLWTATAFVLMLYSTRAQRRPLWMVGAALLGTVVLKLFLNDLSSTGTVERIVSFIGVGAGLLLIGYVAPVPPGQAERQAD